MLLRRAAHNLAESRHLKAVDPSGAQTCPALFPDSGRGSAPASRLPSCSSFSAAGPASLPTVKTEGKMHFFRKTFFLWVDSLPLRDPEVKTDFGFSLILYWDLYFEAVGGVTQY